MKELLKHFPSQNNKDSIFISFEGIEGAGKTSQIETAKKHLESKGFEVISLREPGGTSIGESLRETILNSTTKLHPLTEAHIFCAARAAILSETVLPFLQKEGKTAVILDRYIDSTFAYQGHGRGLGVETILELHKHSPLNTMPNKTFYLKISWETSVARQKLRGQKLDYFEKEKKSFYQKLIEGFDDASSLFPQRVKVIDGEQEQKQVSANIVTALDEMLLNEMLDEHN